MDPIGIIPTNQEIYDAEVKISSNINSQRQIALNAMFTLRKLLTQHMEPPKPETKQENNSDDDDDDFSDDIFTK